MNVSHTRNRIRVAQTRVIIIQVCATIVFGLGFAAGYIVRGLS